MIALMAASFGFLIWMWQGSPYAGMAAFVAVLIVDTMRMRSARGA